MSGVTTKQASGRGFIANFVLLPKGALLNVLFLLAIPIGTLVAYCPPSCRELWPLMELANWINLLFGLLATIALALQVRLYKAAS